MRAALQERSDRMRRLAAWICGVCLAISLIVSIPVSAQTDNNRIPAFPGAEGGGMYTTGGRGGEVVFVTNLNDSGPGSFREAVSESHRIVVFRVGGVIELQSDLQMASDLTVAGQTAPGDGITVIGHHVSISDNTILRYLRFRLGDRYSVEADAFGGRYASNIIIDHCSFSWSVDEVMSVYGIENLTVQWSIISEAMHLSRHVKGKHGYGGIWGGKNATFHHNLIAHNSSRNPAFDSTEGNTHDFRNNVIYNWGYFAAYGGKQALNNLVNNYYKPGPDTENLRFLNAETGGSYYVAGNVMEGVPGYSDNNWMGIHTYAKYIKLEDAVNFPYPVETETAEEAYERVLDEAGAVLPRRDAIDARIVQDARRGTGRQINSQEEVGGYPDYPLTESDVVDEDQDGMPDDWERAHGLNPLDPEDHRGDIDGDGYTNIEQYLNSIQGNGTVNPEITLVSPHIHNVYMEHASADLLVETSDPDGVVEKVVYYANSEKIGESREAPFAYTWESLPIGSYYVTAVAFDDSGTSARSNAIAVHVHSGEDFYPWREAEIGETDVAGDAAIEDGIFMIRGSGRIEASQDRLHFTYVPVSGDFTFRARIDEVSGNDTGSQGGIMLRTGLTPSSAMAFAGVVYDKGGKRAVTLYRTKDGRNLHDMRSPEDLSVEFPVWVKLSRSGHVVTTHFSADGETWVELGSEEIVDLPQEVYIGMTADPYNTMAKQVKNVNTTILSAVDIDPIPAVFLQPREAAAPAVDEIAATVGTDDGDETARAATVSHTERIMSDRSMSAVWFLAFTGLLIGGCSLTAMYLKRRSS